MNIVRGIRNSNVRVLVPKPRAFSSTVSGHKQPESKVNDGESESQTNGGVESKSSMISKFHDFAEEHSVCYNAVSTLLSRRGVFTMVNTGYQQRYFVRWSGFEKKNSSVYVDAKCRLVICGSNRSFLGLGKKIVQRRRQFQLPIAGYNNAVIDAKFHEELNGVMVDITSFTKPSGEVFTIK